MKDFKRVATNLNSIATSWSKMAQGVNGVLQQFKNSDFPSKKVDVNPDNSSVQLNRSNNELDGIIEQMQHDQVSLNVLHSDELLLSKNNQQIVSLSVLNAEEFIEKALQDKMFSESNKPFNSVPYSIPQEEKIDRCLPALSSTLLSNLDNSEDDVDVDDPISFDNIVVEGNEDKSSWDFLFNADLSDIVDDVAPASTKENVDEKDEVDVNILPSVLEELEEYFPKIDTLLSQLPQKNPEVISELHRTVHTTKGAVAQFGLKRPRTLLHDMETVMEDLEAGLEDPTLKQQELIDLFTEVKELFRPFQTGEWLKADEFKNIEVNADQHQIPKSVKISTDVIDKMVNDVNEERLLTLAMSDMTAKMKNKLKELDDSSQKISRMLRDLELQAEIQIQSRKNQIQDNAEGFDPLEFDQFTRLQELSRLMVEGMSDISEDRRELLKVVSEYETLTAQQYRLMQQTQEELHKTRLLPADTIHDRISNDIKNTAKESGKNVSFKMLGRWVELDRVFLEKIKGPLGHIIKNSVVHGIETPEKRRQMNKPENGSITVGFRQTSGRIIIEVIDDGYGLNVAKIKDKAIQKGLWQIDQPMNDAQAADMICAPGFSTADSVSELAGRGVGMDAVRKDILELGGRFEIKSIETKGMTITIQLPASIASASVLVVEAGGESWAVPVELVEHVVLVSSENREQYSNQGYFADDKFAEWNGSPYKILNANNQSVVKNKTTACPVLLIKERGQSIVLEVNKLIQIFEVPLRGSGTIWSNMKGVAGTVILPNGEAIFLLDPFKFTQATVKESEQSPTVGSAQMPLVMVVDDSLTVRKASARFLTRNGYQNIMAKDGQEALELLSQVRPAIILLDIEMPKMDGFDCAKTIRQHSDWKDIPIVMITSRTAEKHRKHAAELGVNEYLGKPFKETELLKILQKLAPR